MALEFTLSRMQLTKEAAEKCTVAYSNAITELDDTIKKLADDWKSDETGTYEEFVMKYNEKRDKLFDARDYMLKFCAKLDEKIQEFQDSANKIKASFE